jgi:hypothetical protein
MCISVSLASCFVVYAVLGTPCLSISFRFRILRIRNTINQPPLYVKSFFFYFINKIMSKFWSMAVYEI